MAVATLLASATRTSNGAAVISLSRDFADAVSGAFMLDVTTDESTAADKLNVYLQHSLDGYFYDDVGHFTEHDGNGGAKQYRLQWVRDVTPTDSERLIAAASLSESVVQMGPVGPHWRVQWVITDDSGSASFGFSVKGQINRSRDNR